MNIVYFSRSFQFDIVSVLRGFNIDTTVNDGLVMLKWSLLKIFPNIVIISISSKALLIKSKKEIKTRSILIVCSSDRKMNILQSVHMRTLF